MRHLAAQRAVVRMLFDPQFAEAARRDPDGVLAELDPVVRRQLVAVDPRAFTVDRLRRRRALRVLAEEFKGTTTLILAETRSLASLEQFFSSAAFHEAVATRNSMPLAFAAWVATQVAEGRLRTPLLGDVLALESAVAHARRAANAQPDPDAAQPGLRLADGVIPVEVAAGALAALQQAERYLFEVSLMPAVALCDDAPRLALDAAAPGRQYLAAVPVSGDVTLVELDEELYRVLKAVGPTPRARRAVLADACARGLTEARAAELLDGLIGDEIVLVAGAGEDAR